MHSFTELIQRSTIFSLKSLNELEEEISVELETGSATHLIKSLQMIRLQKTISAVGMFSIFEAILQDRLSSKDGFREAKKILDSEREIALKERFSDLQLAINVLKHGRGDSYNTLIKKANKLPFRLKKPDESFFFEGDLSEVTMLIEVDDTFVLNCVQVILEVSAVIRKANPDSFD
jgi:hypothetical protein